MLPTSTKLSTLSSVPTQLQHLNNSDLRIAPATPEQIQYMRDAGSREAKRSLLTFFTHSNHNIKKMNRIKHHHRKCVMTLSSGSSVGEAGWFIQLWDESNRNDRADFVSNIGQMVGVGPTDFCVDVFTGPECPVIFYLLSILQPLVQRTFKPIQLPSSNRHPDIVGVWHQALDVLHNPSAHKDKYRDFLAEAYDMPANHKNLMMQLSTSMKLSTLSNLLTQLQDLNNRECECSGN
jgi:hypothetical protein